MIIIKNSFWRILSSLHRITASRQLIAISVILLSLNSCYNEPDVLGGDLFPSGDKTIVQVTDTFKVAAYTIKTDTLITSSYKDYSSSDYTGSPYWVLGCYNDKIFGSIKSNFYTRIFQSNLKDTLTKVIIANRPMADSLVLKLKLKKTWGEKNKTINVRVFRLTSRLDSSKLFNGLINPGISYDPIQVNATTTYSGEEYLKIKFTLAFAEKIMKADTSILSSSDKFMQLIYGLYFTTDSITADKGVLYSFDLNTASFSMYYPKSNPNYRQPLYSLGLGYRLFNYFQHSSINAPLKILSRSLSSITDNTPQDTVFGIEGFGGVRGLIKLKGVKEWKKLMPIIIHRAELRFDIQEHIALPSDSTIKQLYFYNYRDYNSDNNFVYDNLILDSRLSQTPVTTTRYNKAKKYYSIDVTVQLQNLLRSKINRDYIILENDNNRNNYMQGLYRTGNNSKPMKLIITYSKI